MYVSRAVQAPLKQRYRDILAKGRTEVRFVYLKGEEPLLWARLAARRGHYMPASLLPSQIAALEEPRDGIAVAIDGTPETIVTEILKLLRSTGRRPPEPA